MVAIEILNKLHYFAFQGMNNCFNLWSVSQSILYLQEYRMANIYLLASGKKFDHLLQSSGTMLIQSDVHQTRSGSIDKYGTLLMVRELQKLLTEIIAKRVYRELAKHQGKPRNNHTSH
jgi:hypothetical protein